MADFAYSWITNGFHLEASNQMCGQLLFSNEINWLIVFLLIINVKKFQMMFVKKDFSLS